MENMKDTQWDFALVLRQKYQEEIFRRRLKELSVSLEAPVELVDVQVSEAMPKDGYRITAMTKNRNTGLGEMIKCKYLVGADGGRSFVRRALEVPFDGSTSDDKWVRIDGMRRFSFLGGQALETCLESYFRNPIRSKLLNH